MEDSVSQTGLVVVLVGEEYRIDSRLIAKELGLEHKHFLETVRTYQPKLERLGVMPFQAAKPSKGGRGGRPETYAMLNEDQCVFAATLSRNTDEVVEFKLSLTIAFKKVRAQLAEKQAPPSNSEVTAFLNTLWIQRSRLFAKHNRIPHTMFCVYQEINAPFHQAELRGYQLPDGALPDGSVGKRWCEYVRDVLHLDMRLIQKYPHHYPDKRGIQPANLYPVEWIVPFRKWLYEIYLPEHLPQYLKYLRASPDEIDQALIGLGVAPKPKHLT